MLLKFYKNTEKLSIGEQFRSQISLNFGILGNSTYATEQTDEDERGEHGKHEQSCCCSC